MTTSAQAKEIYKQERDQRSRRRLADKERIRMIQSLMGRPPDRGWNSKVYRWLQEVIDIATEELRK